jgi:hypothetical protein
MRSHAPIRSPKLELLLESAQPGSELWLYRNPEALACVKQGLRESAEGKSIDRGSFAGFARKKQGRKLLKIRKDMNIHAVPP